MFGLMVSVHSQSSGPLHLGFDETMRHGEEHLIHQWHSPQSSLEAKRMGKKLGSCISEKDVLSMTKLPSS